MLDEKGAFEKIETLFPAKINTFLDKLQQKKSVVAEDTVKFLTKEKNKNVSK